jgi:hypothetical protein
MTKKQFENTIENYYQVKRVNNVPYLDDNLLIPISTLSSWDFCHREIWLQYFSGLKIPKSEIMENGTKMHDKKYGEEKPKLTKEETKIEDEIFDGMIRNGLIFDMPSIPVISIRNNIFGRTDKIYFNEKYNMIEEFKPNHLKAYDSVKMQIFAYALAFNDMYDSKKEMRVKIINNKGLLWCKIFNLIDEKIIRSKIDEVKNYLLFPYMPNMNSFCPKKCSYYNLCRGLND